MTHQVLMWLSDSVDKEVGSETMVVAAYLNLKSRFRPDEGGASLVEYALLLALITVVCVAAVAFFGNSVGDSFSRSASKLP